ncbi:MAG: hypothetical protein GC181_09970 [Bacteroidetes bacterium]|nr:hypothetical protein [Bacteroidota bacterium]
MEELLEKYVLNQLTGSEKADFETRLQSDAKLAEQVRVFRDLMEASEINYVKQGIQSAQTQYQWRLRLKYAAFALTAVIVAVAFYFLISKNSNPKKSVTAELTPVSSITINSEKDTVIETEKGMLLMIPANCFVDSSGNSLKEIQLQIREVFSASDIIKSGLETLSDSNLLETAGMFHIRAFSGSSSLSIKTGKEILVQVPTKEIQPGMMLFDGLETDGEVNWINPKPIKKYILNLPFEDLNFYPPGFLKKVSELGFDASDRAFNDSLYYSFECGKAALHQEIQYESEDAVQTSVIALPKKFSFNDVQPRLKKPEKQSDSSNDETSPILKKGICPAAIHALQQESFAKTFIASREFEQRLQVIFKTCDESLLNIYLSHLDQDLWYSDSLAALQSAALYKKEFLNFAAEKLTNTENANPGFAALAEYHHRKKAAFDEAIRKTNQAIWERERKEDSTAVQRRSEKSEKEKTDFIANYLKELDINLRDACRQADISEKKISTVNKSYYTFPVTSTGWKNIDQYVTDITRSRSTGKFKYNNRDIELVYQTLQVQITDDQSFDILNCYVIPDSLFAFQRLSKSGNFYSEKLNDLLHYSLVCVGKKGGQFFYYRKNLETKTQQIIISLDAINEKALDKKLARINPPNSNWSLLNDLQYQQEEFLYRDQLEKRKKDAEIQAELKTVIWPCSDGAEPVNGKGTQGDDEIAVLNTLKP